MAGSPKDRGIRLLATLKTLSELTDCNHRISAGELREGIAERASAMAGHVIDVPDKRTLYNDISTLQSAGYDVEREPTTRGKYCIVSNFESWELRFLADAVRASKSLTEDQSERIVDKLKQLAPLHEHHILDRRLEVQGHYISGSFKQTAYALDEIETALDNGWKLSCVLQKRNASGELTTRRERGSGNEKRVYDPVEYVYSSNGHYYLIVSDKSTCSGTKSPRIDRMKEVKAIPGEKAEKLSAEEKGRILEMYKLAFGMFENPKITNVTLQMRSDLVESVLDVFGADIEITQLSPSKSETTVPVGLSHIFYSWISQFKGGIEIVGPEDARSGMRDFLKENLSVYEH